ncbi:hypothetical protein KEM52_001549 [Ascosphaera acerosa]|nr:hypothetical protein KEM52_001549 [Ascosphaera acerosa]
MTPDTFLDGAAVDSIVPHASDANIEQALAEALQRDSQDHAGDAQAALLPGVKQRSVLFFDETVPVYVVLRLARCSEQTLRDHLARLDVSVEAYALSTAAASESGGAGGGTEATTRVKHQIYSGVVSDKDKADPLVVVDGGDGADEAGDGGGNGDGDLPNHIYIIWRTEAYMSRPRVRLNQPTVIISAAVTLNASRLQADDDAYLPRGTPMSFNVLQALADDPASKQYRGLTLPSSRLQRVVPMTPPDGSIGRVQQARSQPINIILAAMARVRYSRASSVSSQPATIASLDFEVTPQAAHDVVLEAANLSIPGGYVDCLTSATGFAPPIVCSPRGDVTLVYRLRPPQDSTSTAGAAGSSTTASMFDLDIAVRATVLLSDDCRAQLSMQWRTHVDFSLPLNPSYGAPTNSMQRSQRPSNLSVSTTAGGPPAVVAPPTDARTHSLSMDDAVSVAFSGPQYVEVGKEFSWDVFIVNRSTKPRRFVLAAVPRRKKLDVRRHIARPTSSSFTGLRAESVAEPVIDDNYVYAMQKNATPYDPDLVCLTLEVRAG